MKNVIIVEDDATMRSLLRTLLEIEGYQIFTSDGTKVDEIFSLLQYHQPSYLLMDVHLKGGDGIEILKSIKVEHNFNVKILMTSGEDFRDVCLKNGADGFLLKPYMPDTLLKWLFKTSA